MPTTANAIRRAAEILRAEANGWDVEPNSLDAAIDAARKETP